RLSQRRRYVVASSRSALLGLGICVVGGGLGAAARVEITQLRLEVALEPSAVLTLERAQLLDSSFECRLALLELGSDRRRALLGIVQRLRRPRRAFVVELLGTCFGVGELTAGLVVRLGQRGLCVRTRFGNESIGLGLRL